MLLVHHKDNIPLIIIRPTLVTSTKNDPFPGWIEGLKYLSYYYSQSKDNILIIAFFIKIFFHIYSNVDDGAAMCHLCGLGFKSADHLFISCNKISHVW
jgi:hypothetical protein